MKTRKRMQVHVVPTDGEEDGEGGRKELKIAEIGCIWGPEVSGKTIKCDIHTNKLFGRVAQRQPFLRTTIKTKHLEFAKHHWYYDCKRMLWLDQNYVLVIHTINMLGGKRGMHTQKITSCLLSNIAATWYSVDPKHTSKKHTHRKVYMRTTSMFCNGHLSL